MYVGKNDTCWFFCWFRLKAIVCLVWPKTKRMENVDFSAKQSFVNTINRPHIRNVSQIIEKLQKEEIYVRDTAIRDPRFAAWMAFDANLIWNAHFAAEKKRLTGRHAFHAWRSWNAVSRVFCAVSEISRRERTVPAETGKSANWCCTGALVTTPDAHVLQLTHTMRAAAVRSGGLGTITVFQSENRSHRDQLGSLKRTCTFFNYFESAGHKQMWQTFSCLSRRVYCRRTVAFLFCFQVHLRTSKFQQFMMSSSVELPLAFTHKPLSVSSLTPPRTGFKKMRFWPCGLSTWVIITKRSGSSHPNWTVAGHISVGAVWPCGRVWKYEDTEDRESLFSQSISGHISVKRMTRPLPNPALSDTSVTRGIPCLINCLGDAVACKSHHLDIHKEPDCGFVLFAKPRPGS